MTRFIFPAFILMVLVSAPLAIWYEVSVWNECRTDHSFLYCMRVLHP